LRSLVVSELPVSSMQAMYVMRALPGAAGATFGAERANRTTPERLARNQPRLWPRICT